MEKACTGCGRTLPATTEYFHRHAPSRDGLKPRCKRCQCEGQAERDAKKSPEERAATIRSVTEWRRSNPNRVHGYNARWRREHTMKQRAHYAVQRALKHGVLHKSPCAECGAATAHAHHDDYAKPLDVRWLCPKHHAGADKARRQAERIAS